MEDRLDNIIVGNIYKVDLAGFTDCNVRCKTEYIKITRQTKSTLGFIFVDMKDNITWMCSEDLPYSQFEKFVIEKVSDNNIYGDICDYYYNPEEFAHRIYAMRKTWYYVYKITPAFISLRPATECNTKYSYEIFAESVESKIYKLNEMFKHIKYLDVNNLAIVSL